MSLVRSGITLSWWEWPLPYSGTLQLQPTSRINDGQSGHALGLRGEVPWLEKEKQAILNLGA